ncbi:MAG TPA: TAXI family TRAP transporter solute-binding subunit [Pseudonocardiaceae bacterium]|nr:TAXI family TRAP transporter solute-binding subunit [Pseudonocardiaceae bacterium]
MPRSGRALVLAVVALVAAATLAGCRGPFDGLRLTIATGSSDGVYYQFGSQLADAWAAELGIARPTVLTTAGSPQNIDRLRDGTADVGFSSADVIQGRTSGRYPLRALARIYDDYIQVVVRTDAPIRDLADLAGRRVSVGPANSQVQVVTDRILSAAGVHGMTSVDLSINDSIAALRAGRIDAFFWSGGLPTQSITALSGSVPVRLLDLGTDPSDVLHTMLLRYPVYGTALVPGGTYGLDNPSVTTLTVPNFLLATTKMPNDVAEALVSGLFSAKGKLTGVTSAARGIDVQSAIYTQPVPLHAGAEAYYRSAKI